ncbi:secreted effector protein PipB2 [Azospirillaceae bacterium]
MVESASGHNSEYLLELDRFLSQHARWAHRRPGGRQIDFSYFDLSRMSLPGVVLSNARMTGVCLAHSNLSRADLQAASLVMADMESVNLSHANLLGADLRGACLNGANMIEANMAGADLRIGAVANDKRPAAQRRNQSRLPSRRTELIDANLNRALMMGAKLENCDLTGAELVDADLSGADLTGAILVATDLSGVTLTNAKIHGAVLCGSTLDQKVIDQIADLGGGAERSLTRIDDQLPKMLVEHKKWLESGGATGQRIELDMVDLSGCVLSGCTLSGAKIQRSLLSEAKLNDADLIMADLAYCTLANADLTQANLSGCILRRANLTNACLKNAILDDVPLGRDQDRPWPTNLQYARLNNCDLRWRSAGGVILRYANLIGAQIDQNTLRTADLQGAKLSEPKPVN